MYPVTDEYKAAIKEKYVEEKLSGTITLKDGTAIQLSDKILVRNSLRIIHELCGKEYKIGTFNLGKLKISIFDDNALLRDFSCAAVRPIYEIKTKNGWETVPLGVYYVDGSSVKRRRNTVSLTAYDCGTKFDRVIPDEMRVGRIDLAYTIKKCCTACDVSYEAIDSERFNADLYVSCENQQIHTYRDYIAWCAALMCCYAVIDRDEKLRFIPAKYTTSTEDSSDIIIDKYLTEKERKSIYVTDTRAYINTLNAYCGKELKTYKSDIEQPDEQAAPATYTLLKNPVLTGYTEEEYDEIFRGWLSFIDGFKQRGIEAEIFGDPALDVGDTLRCSGGDIDQRRSVVGVLTKQEWRYKGLHYLTCTAPSIIFDDISDAETPQSQLDKKITSSEVTAGNGIKIKNSKVSLKPACYDSTGNGTGFGGVSLGAAGSGISVSGDYATISLDNPTAKTKGGIRIGNGLEYVYTSRLKCDWQDESYKTRVAIGKGIKYGDKRETGDDIYCGRQIELHTGDGFEFYLPTNSEGEPNINDENYGRLDLKLGDGLEINNDGALDLKNSSNAEYTEGSAISLTDNKISVNYDPDTLELDTVNNKLKVKNASAGTQYTPGNGIEISQDKKISAKIGDGLKFGGNGEITAKPATKTVIGGVKIGNGIKVSDDGTISLDMTSAEAVVIDHEPTADDLTGKPCVLVRYDPDSAPLVKGDETGIFNASAVYVENYIPGVTGVIVTPSELQINQGEEVTQVFTAEVSGTHNPPQAVTWSISGNTEAGTSINENGLLTVSAAEKAATIIVTAASVYDSSKQGTAIVSLERSSTGTGIWFDNGTGDWDAWLTEYGIKAGGTAEIGDTIYLSVGTGYDRYYRPYSIAASNSPTDLTNISTIYADVYIPSTNASTYVDIAAGTTPATRENSQNGWGIRGGPVAVMGDNTGRFVYELDVSKLTGSYYLSFLAEPGNKLTVYKVWGA